MLGLALAVAHAPPVARGVELQAGRRATNARSLSEVTRRRVPRSRLRQIAESLSIEPFEGRRPGFGRAIAYWVFNRKRDTRQGNVATCRSICDFSSSPRSSIAVALPNRTTRKRPPLCGFVQTAFWEIATSTAVRNRKGTQADSRTTGSIPFSSRASDGHFCGWLKSRCELAI